MQFNNYTVYCERWLVLIFYFRPCQEADSNVRALYSRLRIYPNWIIPSTGNMATKNIKHDTLIQCWPNVGPLFATLFQH